MASAARESSQARPRQAICWSGRTSRETGRRERMGEKETAVSGKNRIMIYGPKSDGTYIVESRGT
jgi:hypothetical protein